jgi:hypothetical protein
MRTAYLLQAEGREGPQLCYELINVGHSGVKMVPRERPATLRKSRRRKR